MSTNWWRVASCGSAASASTTNSACSDIATPRDIGYHFPDTAAETLNVDSKILLRKTVDLIATKGYRIGNVDATVCAERPKLNPHIPEMQRCLAAVMQTDIDNVSIKATTTEKLGFTGRMEGISAYATVLIEKD